MLMTSQQGPQSELLDIAVSIEAHVIANNVNNVGLRHRASLPGAPAACLKPQQDITHAYIFAGREGL